MIWMIGRVFSFDFIPQGALMRMNLGLGKAAREGVSEAKLLSDTNL